MSTAPDNQAAMVAELRSSVAFTAGAAHKARQVAELLRQRATDLQQLPGPTSRSVITELRRMADLIEELP